MGDGGRGRTEVRRVSARGGGYVVLILRTEIRGNLNGGLSKQGLGPKGTKLGQKGPFLGQCLLFARAVRIGGIGPEGPNRPRKASISPEKARFFQGRISPIFSENLGLKPPLVSPPFTLVIKMITCNFFLFWGINFLRITITITSFNP